MSAPILIYCFFNSKKGRMKNFILPLKNLSYQSFTDSIIYTHHSELISGYVVSHLQRSATLNL